MLDVAETVAQPRHGARGLRRTGTTGSAPGFHARVAAGFRAIAAAEPAAAA